MCKEELVLLACRVGLHMALIRLQQCQAFPSSPTHLRVRPPPFLHSLVRRLRSLSHGVQMEEPDKAFIQRCLQACPWTDMLEKAYRTCWSNLTWLKVQIFMEKSSDAPSQYYSSLRSSSSDRSDCQTQQLSVAVNVANSGNQLQTVSKSAPSY